MINFSYSYYKSKKLESYIKEIYNVNYLKTVFV